MPRTRIHHIATSGKMVSPKDPMQPKPTCISIDPPWPEQGGGQVKRGADRHYDLLPVRDIAPTILRATWPDGSPVFDPDPSGAHVWLWVTGNRLADGLRILEALGARYINHRAWVKARPEASTFRLDRIGLGQYVRGVHETVLLGTIGNLPSQNRTVPSVLIAPRGAHSAKPDQHYDDARAIAGAVHCVEMFGRGPRDGWRVWGNEADGVKELDIEALFLRASMRGEVPGLTDDERSEVGANGIAWLAARITRKRQRELAEQWGKV